MIGFGSLILFKSIFHTQAVVMSASISTGVGVVSSVGIQRYKTLITSSNKQLRLPRSGSFRVKADTQLPASRSSGYHVAWDMKTEEGMRAVIGTREIIFFLCYFSSYSTELGLSSCENVCEIVYKRTGTWNMYSRAKVYSHSCSFRLLRKGRVLKAGIVQLIEQCVICIGE